MKKTIFCILLLPLVMTSDLYGEVYSLDDLFRIALERAETIKIAEEDLYISEKEKDKAVAGLLPTVSAFGNHVHYTKKQFSPFGLLQPDYSDEWGLRVGKTFSLGGSEFTSYKIGKEGVRKSGYELHAAKEGYLFDIALRYFTVLSSRKSVDIARTNVERLTRYRYAAKRRLEVGEATKTALLRAEAELAGAQSDLIKSENNLKLAKTTLARTAGIDVHYDLSEPTANTGLTEAGQEQSDIHFITGDCRLPVIDCLKEKAYYERAELRSLTIQKEIADEEVRFARSSYWPDLSIEGVYAREENEPSRSFELNERIYGAVSLNFPLFEGGLRKAEVSEAKARMRQAEYRLSDVKREIGKEVENSYLILITEASVLDTLRAEVTYALDNYNAVTKQYQYGLSDSIDVIDANTLLLTSERELSNAEYSYQLAILRLEKATGILLNSVLGKKRE